MTPRPKGKRGMDGSPDDYKHDKKRDGSTAGKSTNNALVNAVRENEVLLDLARTPVPARPFKLLQKRNSQSAQALTILQQQENMVLVQDVNVVNARKLLEAELTKLQEIKATKKAKEADLCAKERLLSTHGQKMVVHNLFPTASMTMEELVESRVAVCTTLEHVSGDEVRIRLDEILSKGVYLNQHVENHIKAMARDSTSSRHLQDIGVIEPTQYKDKIVLRSSIGDNDQRLSMVLRIRLLLLDVVGLDILQQASSGTVNASDLNTTANKVERAEEELATAGDKTRVTEHVSSSKSEERSPTTLVLAGSSGKKQQQTVAGYQGGTVPFLKSEEPSLVTCSGIDQPRTEGNNGATAIGWGEEMFAHEIVSTDIPKKAQISSTEIQAAIVDASYNNNPNSTKLLLKIKSDREGYYMEPEMVVPALAAALGGKPIDPRRVDDLKCIEFDGILMDGKVFQKIATVLQNKASGSELPEVLVLKASKIVSMLGGIDLAKAMGKAIPSLTPNLQALEIPSASWGDSGIEHLKAIFKLKSLICIDLSDNGMSAKGLSILAGAIQEKTKKIKVLRLQANSLKDKEALKCLNELLPKLSEIKELSIGNQKSADDEDDDARRSLPVTVMSGLSCMTAQHLEVLDIEGFSIHGESGILGLLMNASNLRVVNMAGTSAFAHLAKPIMKALVALKNLEILNMSSMLEDEDGGSHGEALQLFFDAFPQSLKILTMEAMDISDKVLSSCISKLLEKEEIKFELEELSLAYNEGLTGESFGAICDLCRVLPNLRSLDLQETALSEEENARDKVRQHVGDRVQVEFDNEHT